MSRFIIHVGLHKTGSTFLQQQVFPSLAGVSLITRPYTQYNHAFNRLQYADDSLYDRDAVRAELDDMTGERILISDESLSGKPFYFNYVNRSLIVRRLKNLLPDATIILFLRGQVDLILSLYNQYVRMGGTKDIAHCLWKPEVDFRLEGHKHETEYSYHDPRHLHFNTNDCFIHLQGFLYTPLLRLYRDAFPRVEVFLYEDLVHRQDEVLSRLSRLCGCSTSWPAGTDRVDDARRINPSVSDQELDRIRFRNRLRGLSGVGLVRHVAEFGHRLRRWSTGAAGRSNTREYVRTFVGDYFAEDNRRIAAGEPELGLERYSAEYGV